MTWKSESIQRYRDQAVVWRVCHPEWWPLLLAAVAWGWLLGNADLQRMVWLSDVAIASWQRFLLESVFAPLCSAVNNPGNSFALRWLGWELMVVAMMFPGLTNSVRLTAFASFAQRRQVAVLEFLVGYLGVWAMAGAVGLALSTRFAQVNIPWAALVLLFCGWELTQTKRRAWMQCHRAPILLPTGHAADLSCLRWGVVQGAGCVGSCWAFMLPMVLPNHPPLMMWLAFALVLLQRLLIDPAGRRYRFFIIGVAALAAIQLTASLTTRSPTVI